MAKKEPKKEILFQKDIAKNPDLVTKQKFKVPCTVNGMPSGVDIYIGNPKKDSENPIQYQSAFLASEKNIIVSPSIIETLKKLKDIADRNGVPFLQLCEYALKSIEIGTSAEQSQQQAKITNEIKE